MPATVADRQQAEQELRSKNQKIVYNVPEELKDTGKPIYIFNLSPKSYQRSMGSYGQFLIPACSEGRKYSEALIIPRVVYDMYHEGMFKMIATPDSGRKLAMDILGFGAYHAPDEDLRKWGVFIAESEKPSEAELKEAQGKLDRTWDRLIQEADNLWASGPSHYKNVTDEPLYRTAALARGQMDKEWVKGSVPKRDCPTCGNQIAKSAAFCIHCRTIFDESRVIANKVPGYEHLWGKKSA
jgi:hypothetical protein